MSQSLSPPAPTTTQEGAGSLENLDRALARSTGFAWCVIAGLPFMGSVSSLLLGMPFFAALMAGSFLMGAGLTCRRALATFVGSTLRLLVTARLVFLLALAGLLFCTSGSVWVGVVSALLTWLTTDRLLGRRALYDLWKLTRS
jgi:hypothetical protein